MSMLQISMAHCGTNPGYGILWYNWDSAQNTVLGTFSTKAEAYSSLERVLHSSDAREMSSGAFYFYYTNLNRELMSGAVLESLPPDAVTKYRIFLQGKKMLWAPADGEARIFRYINRTKKVKKELEQLTRRELLERYRASGGRWPMLTSVLQKRKMIAKADREANHRAYGLEPGQTFPSLGNVDDQEVPAPPTPPMIDYSADTGYMEVCSIFQKE